VGWLCVYSSDDKNVGEVAKLNSSDLFVDIGGLLGIGETRVLIRADQIQDVRDDVLFFAAGSRSQEATGRRVTEIKCEFDWAALRSPICYRVLMLSMDAAVASGPSAMKRAS
jgi:hypothetical protein